MTPKNGDCKNLRIVEIEPHKVHTPPTNCPVTAEAVTKSGLLASIEKDQLLPGIIWPRQEMPGHFWCGDGNHRLLCQRILGRMFKAIVLDKEPDADELARIRVMANFHRRNPSAYQLAREIRGWLERDKSRTQKMAAAFFTISEGTCSKILAKAANACQAVREAEENGLIVPDVARLFATLPDHDQQREALGKAIETPEHPAMSRDAVEAMVARMKGVKKPKIKSVAITPAMVRHVVVSAIEEIEKTGQPLRNLPDIIVTKLKGTT
jgi:hypothetical protein